MILRDEAAEAPAAEWVDNALLRTDTAFVVVSNPDAPAVGTVINEAPTGTTTGIS